jgi:glycosyltransferase involved in cell wall biosynthesis
MPHESRRLNVLVVNWQDLANPNAGGAEIHLHEIFGRLAGWGHRVTLLASGWEGAADYDEADGMAIVRVGSRYTFPLHAKRAFRGIESSAFDVIVEDINKLPLFTPRWSQVPVVGLVPHLFGSTAFAQESIPVASAVWFTERLMPFVYGSVPFEVISESTADDLVGRGFDRERITVSYPGIDHVVCTPHPDGISAIRAEEPLIAYIGRLQRYKGVETVLRAVAALRNEGLNVRFAVAGRGEDRERLERLTASLGIEAQVDFMGYISEEAKIELLRSAWSNVYPSPKEGWGITNIEAAACGTPSLASDSPGLRESVVNGETGVLVRHGDVAAWAESIRWMCDAPERVTQLGRAAVEYAARFTWEETAKQTEELLYSIA